MFYLLHIITDTSAKEEKGGNGNIEPEGIQVNMAISVNMEGMNGPFKEFKDYFKLYKHCIQKIILSLVSRESSAYTCHFKGLFHLSNIKFIPSNHMSVSY